MARHSSAETAVDPVISVRDLTKVYGQGDAAVRAVDGVSFDISPGTVVGVLGPNGAGKTSAIKMMLGLVTPTAGDVRIAGTDALSNTTAIYRHVGAMLEGARNVYWRLTVRENVEFFASLSGFDPRRTADYHDALIERYGLEDKADTPVRELSRGMKQKVSLICTLARRTDVIFLDEPTLGLDVETSLDLRREIRRLTDDRSMTVVLSSHDMDLVEAVCDRVIIVRAGRIVADDTVENLVELFRTQAYQLTVGSPLSEAAKGRLEHRYNAQGWERIGEHVRFEATPRSDDSVYTLVDELQREAVPLVSIQSLQPDLENVFLELTTEAARPKTQNGGER
ncbi:ABC transporter ATP-binding protein [Natrialba asiatica]|uniref:ABC transporter n=1 Tax=Natrialba asiatica (strain ATCC 700177 / DSM 12278 / JCM 9576 / FERM P-10747 / NBRC 102637 / 172P1) TaxID=29540 RepID=M0AYY0_NATA1|nr:ABC transporter ATP-binding protein [Natrialba asiatica]ELZ02629.1 ABC transporter [Natrialba asiatica DSM 12278]